MSAATLNETILASLAGDDNANDLLTSQVYENLRALAGKYLGRERVEHTLQPTALVNEAYMRLVDADEMNWDGRSHFVAIAAITMRRVLVEHARARMRAKRGGTKKRTELNEDLVGIETWEPADVLALNEAIESLAAEHPRPAKVVDLRYFAGLSLEETAKNLGVSTQTIKVDWRFARAWLNKALG